MKISAPTLKPIPIGEPRPLVREDLELLHQGGRTTASIKRLRASHHKIARLAAYGLDNKQIAAHTGYTRERVGQLLGAPAMKELVARLSEQVEEQEKEELDVYLRLKTANMIAAERHIADAIAELDDQGELLPIKTALAISADAADRTGYGKHHTNTNVNYDMGKRLEDAIRRSGKTIEGTSVPSVAAQGPPKMLASLPGVSMATSPASPRPIVTRRLA